MKFVPNVVLAANTLRVGSVGRSDFIFNFFVFYR